MNRNELAQALMVAAGRGVSDSVDEQWMAKRIVHHAAVLGFDAETEAATKRGFRNQGAAGQAWTIVALAANFLADEGITIQAIRFAAS